MTAGFSFPLFFCSLYLVSLFSRYNEVCDPGYDFTSPSFSAGTGHFTQVVWKGSTVLGIGRAEGTMRGMKCTYTVARYRPAGNMMGAFAQNVVVGSFDSDSYCASVSLTSMEIQARWMVPELQPLKRDQLRVVPSRLSYWKARRKLFRTSTINESLWRKKVYIYWH